MMTRASVWLVSVLMGMAVLVLTAMPSDADRGSHRGGGHRGGGHHQHQGFKHPGGFKHHGGFKHSGGFRHHGPSHHGGWKHRGGYSRHWGPRVFLGAPLGYAAWYGWPRYTIYAPPPVVVEPPPPPVYVQPDPPPYWYYCQNPPGFYPEVTACPEGWIQVAPHPGAPTP